eukprot:2010566-Pleurochrysis_carterae.AAC.1
MFVRNCVLFDVVEPVNFPPARRFVGGVDGRRRQRKREEIEGAVAMRDGSNVKEEGRRERWRWGM